MPLWPSKCPELRRLQKRQSAVTIRGVDSSAYHSRRDEHLSATAPGHAATPLYTPGGGRVARRRGHIGDKAALERIREIRQTDRNHHFTLVCRDLSEVGKYALVDNWQYRLLRAHTPGPYTFLLKASRETPRRLKHERRGTIGLRVPDHPVTAMLLSELGEPVMSSTLLLPGEEHPRTDAKEIYERLERSVDMVLDGGNCGMTPTSVIDLSSDRAIVVREGRGDVSPFAPAATV
jgi:tRNA threonylcarbamoyl adenosine modification protein (Sua5/YciO/YrdC/YwlC family)